MIRQNRKTCRQDYDTLRWFHQQKNLNIGLEGCPTESIIRFIVDCSYAFAAQVQVCESTLFLGRLKILFACLVSRLEMEASKIRRYLKTAEFLPLT